VSGTEGWMVKRPDGSLIVLTWTTQRYWYLSGVPLKDHVVVEDEQTGEEEWTDAAVRLGYTIVPVRLVECAPEREEIGGSR
jgi:hypothetical protein